MIVKIQQSLSTSDRKLHVLLYNEDRSFMQEFDGQLAKTLTKALEGAAKGFFEVTIVHDSLSIGEQVEDPGW